MKYVLERATTHISMLIAGVVVMIFAVALIIASQVNAQAQVQSQSGTLVTVHDRGVDTIVLTTGSTIGEVLNEAGIELANEDVVEPSVDQEIVASEYDVNIYRARPVIVVDGMTRQKVMTPYQTAEQIASSAGITLYPEDETEIVRSDDILTGGAGLELHISRATEFSFQLYGKKATARTQGDTIGEMLDEKGIVLGENDKVSASLDTPISSEKTVTVWREGRQTVTVEEDITFSTEKIRDANQPVGYSEIRTIGLNGTRNVTYEIEIRDGKEVKRTEIASLVTKQPIDQVEVIGTYLELIAGYAAERVSIMSAAGITPRDHGFAAYIIDNENALWCPIRWQGTIGCAANYYEKFPGAETSDQVGYGLCQSTPAIKMETAGSDWRTNVVTQMKWCTSYALGRYGSWEAAYNFKVANGWW
jgi:uncharacterized protein YabE (DUF348 family)